jgi:hypothetical protein
MAKKEKKEKKEKAAKGAQPGNAGASPDGGKSGGVIYSAAALLSALLVIAFVIGGFLFFIVKADVFGVSDTYRDSIEKIPVLSLALPEIAKIDPSDMTFEELVAKFEAEAGKNDALSAEIDAANDRIEELSQAKSEFDAMTLVLEEKNSQLERQVALLEANKKELDDMRYDVERTVASGDKAAFAKYYESVSPEVAQEIYAQALQEEKGDEEKKRFIKLFETLDTKTSAQIIETLGPSRIDFITETLNAVKRDIAAEIIGQLNAELAAQVTLRLSGN